MKNFPLPQVTLEAEKRQLPIRFLSWSLTFKIQYAIPHGGHNKAETRKIDIFIAN